MSDAPKLAPTPAEDRARRNRRTLSSLAMIVVGMGCLAYASVPLYKMFCQVTGFGGTTQRADAAPGAVSDRIITVRFDATTSTELPWEFRPVQREVKVRVGENTLIHYEARNLGNVPVTGQATFNVTPDKSGIYFDKIACFCFDEQTLGPGERADMPVSFFLDPALLNDRKLDDVNTITLSYTFFRAKTDGTKQPAKAADAPTGAPPSRL